MTDWESHYLRGEMPWDKGGPSPGLVDFLRASPLTGRVLVPGCGLGHDVRAIAEAGAAETVGLDIAPSAVALARERLADLPNVRIVEANLFALPAEFSGAFDAVFEHTCFCAIPRERREDYVRAVADVLKPDGSLLALFYLNPRDDPDPTLGPPFGVTIEELDQRFGPFFRTLRSETPVAAYPGREGRELLRLLRRGTDSPNAPASVSAARPS